MYASTTTSLPGTAEAAEPLPGYRGVLPGPALYNSTGNHQRLSRRNKTTTFGHFQSGTRVPGYPGTPGTRNLLLRIHALGRARILWGLPLSSQVLPPLLGTGTDGSTATCPYPLSHFLWIRDSPWGGSSLPSLLLPYGQPRFGSLRSVQVRWRF